MKTAKQVAVVTVKNHQFEVSTDSTTFVSDVVTAGGIEHAGTFYPFHAIHKIRIVPCE